VNRCGPIGAARLDSGKREYFLISDQPAVQPILQAQGVTKAFGHVQALVGADVDLMQGEILAIVGDNGAGKSTLIKCLSGAYVPDEGEIRVDGHTVQIRSPHDAQALGIATVYQDLALVDQRDVATNLCMGREPIGRFGLVDRKALVRQADATLARLNSRIPSANTPVAVLSGGQRQAVAIGRALAQGGRVIIMDEPTAALGVRESAQVLELIGSLRSQGIAVGVVSHNLQHVFAIADRILVMRGGRCVGARRREQTTGEEIVRMITGADVLIVDAVV
jgi:ABC-type sugar transport system ATPase subunit